jgi:anaerobic magnesium-protoporphyrin IX monomethyl ester cyclase
MNNRKRILFVIPPYFDVNDYLHQSTSTALPAFTIPYGVLAIDAFIKSKSNVETALVDLNIEALKILRREHEYHASDFDDLVNREVRNFNPDIVAISALFNTSYNYVEAIAATVKAQSDSILTVIGGGLPTNLYKQILEEIPFIDAACYGEGEMPMADLVNSLDYEKLFGEHPSWADKKAIESGKVLVNSFVQDLDEIPAFDFSLVNLDDYNARSLDKRYSDQESKREMSIHTSRGCPFKCVFCANGKLHGMKLRFMSVDKVINDVKMMKDKFGLTVLMIEDDNFLYDKKRAKTILRKLGELNLRIEFPNGLAVYAIDEEIGQLLKSAGTTTIPLAVESGSDYVLQKVINKPLKSSMIKDRVKILRKNGIQVHAFIVIGLPGEAHEHRLETMNLLNDVGFDWVHVFIAIPIVGSRLYDICVDNHYLVNNDLKNHIISKANIKAPGIDPVEIEEFAYYMNLSVNFVNNFNMSQERYEKAAKYFINVVQKYPEHAFAHYFLSKAYGQMDYDPELVSSHMSAFSRSVENNQTWKKYANLFNLTSSH